MLDPTLNHIAVQIPVLHSHYQLLLLYRFMRHCVPAFLSLSLSLSLSLFHCLSLSFSVSLSLSL